MLIRENRNKTNLESLSREGKGNPLQYSCLKNPMDGGAWWSAVHGVAQSQTRLKRLSSSDAIQFSCGTNYCYTLI